MSTPAIRPSATGSANPLHVNLSAPPVGTRTTITLERNSATSGVALTTESMLISDIQEEAPGIIGCCMGYVKRTWASICNWFLYVFHFFFPPSALSAIEQVQQNMERSNHEQRRWMEERQAEMVQLLQRGVRPGEPPAVATIATANGSTTAAPGAVRRPTMESLEMAGGQRERLLTALRKLYEIRSLVEAVTDTQIGRGAHWENAAVMKQEYRATIADAERFLRELNDLSRYSYEGEEVKMSASVAALTHTSVSEIPEIVGVETHTRNISNLVNPPATTTSTATPTPPGGSGSGTGNSNNN